MSIQIDPKLLVQKIELTDDALQFLTPCSICISGGSQSGKSTLISKLVEYREQLFDQRFSKVFYCQPASLCVRNNPIFEHIIHSCPNAELVCGLPDVSKLNLDFDSTAKLVIVDDLMTDFLNSPQMIELLSVQTHHSNITVIFTLHNYFASSKFGRTFARNLQYKIFFYNRLDQRESRIVSSQMGFQPSFLYDCFYFLMQKFPDQNPYLLIDGNYKSKMKSMFIRSHIFPVNNEIKPIIFCPE